MNIGQLEDPLIVARFWSKVRVGRPTECWPWVAKSKANFGYGLFNPRAGGKLIRAHRFAFVLVNGALGDKTVVRHTCDNPPCCNPSHLVAGTQADNVADMHKRGRRKYESRLSDSQILEIAERCRRGERVANVAREYGVSASYVSLLANGKRRAQLLEQGGNNGE